LSSPSVADSQQAAHAENLIVTIDANHKSQEEKRRKPPQPSPRGKSSDTMHSVGAAPTDAVDNRSTVVQAGKPLTRQLQSTTVSGKSRVNTKQKSPGNQPELSQEAILYL
jgi:hypothetical protein